MRRSVAVLLLVLCLSTAALSDTIHLKNGGKFEGTLIEKTSTHYVFKIRGMGVQKFAIREVARVEESATAEDELAKRRKALPAGDAAAAFELGRWCETQKLRKEARALFRKVLEIDPQHAGAREKLGYQRFAGKWVTGKERAELEERDKQELDTFLTAHRLAPTSPVPGKKVWFWGPTKWKREDDVSAHSALLIGPTVARLPFRCGIGFVGGTVKDVRAVVRKALKETRGDVRYVEDPGPALIAGHDAVRDFSGAGEPGLEIARTDLYLERDGEVIHVWVEGPGSAGMAVDHIARDMGQSVEFAARSAVKGGDFEIPTPRGWGDPIAWLKAGIAELERVSKRARERQITTEELKEFMARRERREALRDVVPAGGQTLYYLKGLAFVHVGCFREIGSSGIALSPYLAETAKRYGAPGDASQARRVAGRPGVVASIPMKGGVKLWLCLFGKGDVVYTVVAMSVEGDVHAATERAFHEVLDKMRIP